MTVRLPPLPEGATLDSTPSGFPPLPPGATLDQSVSLPPLPSGAVLDEPASAVPVPAPSPAPAPATPIPVAPRGAIASPSKEAPPKLGLWGQTKLAGKAIGTGLATAVTDVFPQAVAGMVRGKGVPLQDVSPLDRYIAEQQADRDRMNLTEQDGLTPAFGLEAQRIQNAAANLGYSAAVMIPQGLAQAVGRKIGMPVGGAIGATIGGPAAPATAATGAVVGGAVGGQALGMTAGYQAAKRADMNQVLRQYRDAALQANPNMTEAEWAELKQGVDAAVERHGRAEGLWEAVGNAASLGLMKLGARWGTKIPLPKALAKPLGVVAGAAIDQPIEVGSEVLTQIDQAKAEQEMGLRPAGPPITAGQALSEVGPETLITGALTMGIGGGIAAGAETVGRKRARAATMSQVTKARAAEQRYRREMDAVYGPEVGQQMRRDILNVVNGEGTPEAKRAAIDAILNPAPPPLPGQQEDPRAAQASQSAQEWLDSEIRYAEIRQAVEDAQLSPSEVAAREAVPQPIPRDVAIPGPEAARMAATAPIPARPATIPPQADSLPALPPGAVLDRPGEPVAQLPPPAVTPVSPSGVKPAPSTGKTITVGAEPISPPEPAAESKPQVRPDTVTATEAEAGNPSQKPFSDLRRGDTVMHDGKVRTIAKVSKTGSGVMVDFDDGASIEADPADVADVQTSQTGGKNDSVGLLRESGVGNERGASDGGGVSGTRPPPQDASMPGAGSIASVAGGSSPNAVLASSRTDKVTDAVTLQPGPAGTFRHKFKTPEGRDASVLITPPGWSKGQKSYEVTIDRTGGPKDADGRTKFYPTVTIGKYRSLDAAKTAAAETASKYSTPEASRKPDGNETENAAVDKPASDDRVTRASQIIAAQSTKERIKIADKYDAKNPGQGNSFRAPSQPGEFTKWSEELIAAIDAKDADRLRSILGSPGFNEGSRMAFSEITGVKLPKTRRDTETVIDSWAGVTPEERSRRDSAKKSKMDASDAAKELERARRDANAINGQASDGTKQPLADWVDSLFEKGFNRVVQTGKKGATPTYAIANESGQGYAVVHPTMLRYARAKAAMIPKPEVQEPATPPSAEQAKPLQTNPRPAPEAVTAPVPAKATETGGDTSLTPELMTPEEWDSAGKAVMVHKEIVTRMAGMNEPVSAAAVDAYGIKLPPGYVRQGDRYVYSPAASTASASAVVPAREAVPATQPTEPDWRDGGNLVRNADGMWEMDDDTITPQPTAREAAESIVSAEAGYHVAIRKVSDNKYRVMVADWDGEFGDPSNPRVLDFRDMDEKPVSKSAMLKGKAAQPNDGPKFERETLPVPTEPLWHGTKYAGNDIRAGGGKDLHGQGIWFTNQKGYTDASGNPIQAPADDPFPSVNASEYAVMAPGTGKPRLVRAKLTIKNPAKVFDSDIAKGGITVAQLKAQGFDGAHMLDTGAWVAFDHEQVSVETESQASKSEALNGAAAAPATRTPADQLNAGQPVTFPKGANAVIVKTAKGTVRVLKADADTLAGAGPFTSVRFVTVKADTKGRTDWDTAKTVEPAAPSKAEALKGGKKADPNIGREWDSPYGRQRITKVEFWGGRDNYTVLTPDTGAERIYEASRIESIIKDNEYALTPEYAKEQADRKESDRVTKERDDKEKADDQQQRAEIAEFTSGKPPMVAGKIRDALMKVMSFDGQLMSRKAFIDKSVANGFTVQTSTRGRELTSPDGSFWSQSSITSAALDYAEYLIGRRSPESTPRTPESTGDAVPAPSKAQALKGGRKGTPTLATPPPVPGSAVTPEFIALQGRLNLRETTMRRRYGDETFDAEARATADKGRTFATSWKPPFKGATHPVEALSKIIVSHPTLPVLETIAVKDGIATSTDLEATIQAPVPLPDGIYRRLKGSDILIIEQGPEGLDDFPYGFSTVSDPTTVKLSDGREFMQALRAAQAAASDDQTREQLMMVWVSKVNDGSLSVAASDGRRLTSTTISADASKVPDGWSIGITPSAVTALLADPHGENMTIEAGKPALREDGSQKDRAGVRFSNGNTTVIERLPDVSRPDFAPLLAKPTDETLTVDRKAFGKALATLKKMAGKVREGVVVGMNRDGSTLTLKVKDARGKEFTQAIPVEVSPGRQATGMVSLVMPHRGSEGMGDSFYLPYLTDAAKGGTSAKVSFGLLDAKDGAGNPSRPVMFESAIEEFPKAPDTTPTAADAWQPETVKGRPSKPDDMLRATAAKMGHFPLLSRMIVKNGIGRTTDLENEVEAPTSQPDGLWESRGNAWVEAEEKPDEFPTPMESGKAKAAFKFSGEQAQALKAGLLAVQDAASTDETRYILNGVLVDVAKDGSVSLVGTDGRRLHIATAGKVNIGGFSGARKDDGVQMILTRQAVKLLLQSNGAGPITVKLGSVETETTDDKGKKIKGKQDIAEITDGNITLRTKLIEGQYPNFRQVIPDAAGQKIKLRVNRKALGQAVSEVMPYIGADPAFKASLSMRLDVSAKSIVVRTPDNTPQYRMEKTVPVAKSMAFEGDALSIAFIPGFLMDMVKSGDSEVVEIGLTDELSPITISNEDGSQKGVLMPMRLSARGDSASKTLPPLVAMHNLSEKNLSFAEEMGGLAMPSLGIGNAKDPYEGFGDITLIGRPELVDPKVDRSMKVANTDQYSPRYPSATHLFSKGVDKVWKPIEQWLKDTYGDMRSDSLKSEDYDIRSAQYGLSGHLEASGRFKDDGVEGMMRDKALMAYYAGTKLGRIFKNTNELDNRIALEDFIGKEQKDKFEAWVRETFSPFVERKIFKGFSYDGRRKRYAPYTLDYVMKGLRSAIRSKEGEGFFYGAGSVRAAIGAKRYRTLEQIKADRGRLQSGIEGEKKQADDRLQEIAELGTAAYNQPSDGFGYSETFWNAVIDAMRSRTPRAKLKEYGFDYDLMPWTEIRQFTDDLKAMPAEYFEAKPERVVQLQEFTGAVVPSYASPRTLEILKRHGIEVESYDKSKPGDRARAIDALSFRQNVQFRRDLFAGQPAGIEPDRFQSVLADETRAVRFAAEGTWGGRFDDADPMIQAAVGRGEGQAAVDPEPSRISDEAEKRWPGVEVTLTGSEDGRGRKTWHLSSIVVPKGQRNQGIGTEIMEFIGEQADKAGAIVTLSPSTDLGGSSVERLRKFYRRFEFVKNTGRTADYSLSGGMYRRPRFHRTPTGQVRAVTIGTRSYFFTDRYDNESQLRGDIREEAGHRLVNEVGAAQWRRIGFQTYRGRWGAIQGEIQRNYGFAPGTPEFNHELIAKAFRDGKQEAGLLTRFMDAVMTAVRGIGRRLGLDLTLSDAEVRNALRGMLEAKARGMRGAGNTGRGIVTYNRQTPKRGDENGQRLDGNDATAGQGSTGDRVQGRAVSGRVYQPAEWSQIRAELRDGWRQKLDAARSAPAGYGQTTGSGFEGVDYSDTFEDSEGFKRVYEHFAPQGFDVVPVANSTWGGAVDFGTRTVYVQANEDPWILSAIAEHEQAHIDHRNGQAEIVELNLLVDRNSVGFKNTADQFGLSDADAADEVVAGFIAGSLDGNIALAFTDTQKASDLKRARRRGISGRLPMLKRIGDEAEQGQPYYAKGENQADETEWRKYADDHREEWDRLIRMAKDLREDSQRRGVELVAAPDARATATLVEAGRRLAAAGRIIVPVRGLQHGGITEQDTEAIFINADQTPEKMDESIRHETFHALLTAEDEAALRLYNYVNRSSRTFTEDALAWTKAHQRQWAAVIQAALDRVGARSFQSATGAQRVEIKRLADNFIADELTAEYMADGSHSGMFANAKSADRIRQDILPIRRYQETPDARTPQERAAGNWGSVGYAMGRQAAVREGSAALQRLKDRVAAAQAQRKAGQPSAEPTPTSIVKEAVQTGETRAKLTVGEMLSEYDDGKAANAIAMGRMGIRAAANRLVNANLDEQRAIRKELLAAVKLAIPTAKIRDAFNRDILAALVARRADPKRMERALRQLDEVMDKQQRRSLIGAIKSVYAYAVDSMAINVGYRQRIRALMDGFLMTKPSAATIAKARELADFLQAEAASGSGMDMTLNRRMAVLLGKLSRVPLADLDVGQLQDIFQELSLLATQGKLYQQGKRQQEIDRMDADMADVRVQGVRRFDDPVKELGIIGDPPRFTSKFVDAMNSAGDALRKWYRWHLPTDRQFDLMDDYQHYKGVMYRLYKGRANMAFKLFRSDLYPVEQELKAVLKRHNIGRRESIRIGVYGVDQQTMDNDPKYGRRKLYNTMGADTPERQAEVDRQVEAIVLTPDERAVYEWMLAKFEEVAPDLQRVANDVYNVEFDKIQRYWPMQTDWEITENDPVAGYEMNEFGQLMKKNPEKGMIKARTGSGDQRVQIDSARGFLKHMSDAYYMVRMAPETKYMAELARRPDMLAAVGKEGQRMLLEFTDTMARKGGVSGDHVIRWADTLRRNVGVGTLGFRITSALIQPTSFINAMGILGPRGFKGAYDITQPGRLRWIVENSTEIRDRVGDDPSFTEWGGSRLAQKAVNAGYWMLERLDQLTAAAVFSAAYESNMRKRGMVPDYSGPADREAVEDAENVVRVTQASGNFKDVPMGVSRGKLLKSHSLSRMLYQFQTFSMNTFAYIAHDGIGNALNNKEWGKAGNMVLWTTLAFLAEEGIRTGIASVIGGGGDDDKDYTEEVIWDFLGTVPLFGQLAGSIRYSSIPIPLVSAVAKVSKGLSQATQGAAPETRARGAIRTAGALATLGGLPGSSQVSDIAARQIKSDSERIRNMIEDSAKRLPKTASVGRISLEAQRTYNQARRDGLLKPGTTAAEFRARYKATFKRINNP